jgi:acetylornithine deacetylase
MDLQETQSLLFDLIAIDSTSHRSNEPIVSYIANRLSGSDVRCYTLPSKEEGKFNLVALKGDPRDDGSGLTLCGHMDTVPADSAQWESDPWKLTSRDERWYARGSCDMKGFLAIAIHAIQITETTNAPLALLLTCDEELGSFGAQHIVEHGLPIPLPNQVIIGEPTSLQVVRLHKGHLSMRVDIKGVAAHTGAPHLGKNAVIAASTVAVALSELASVFETERTEESAHFTEKSAFPVLTVSTMQGGSAINVVPDHCSLGLGLRLLPDQDQDETVSRLRQTIEQSCELPWTLTMLGDNPTLLTNKSAPINQWLCNHIDQHHAVGVSFGTDGGYLARMGFECVLYGPGDIAVAHKPDEFVPINEMEQCSATIEQAIAHFCGEGV